MEDSHSSSCSNNNNNAATHVNELVNDGNGSVNGAKYRLLSPAKLPISRSNACITIPPGLSPTSFLESPVLLSNIKAEPSPTTGSFFKSHLMQGSVEKAAVSVENNYPNGNNVDERTSSSFEFQFHTGASSTLGLSSSGGLVVSKELNRDRPGVHQDHCYSQPMAMAMAMHESSVCSTVDESNQNGQINTQAASPENKNNNSTVLAERTSEDGYNWRKYGQKLVKGSEFPRSYYKCTYPNCEVKKIFERSPSGQITEIVYKGSHDHPKPQPARRHNQGALISIQEDSPFAGQEDKLNTNNMDPNASPMLPSLKSDGDGINGSGSQLGICDDVNEDDPFQKRRKMEDGIDVTPIVQPIREPRVVVQTVSEVDILDDGYRWRKYGQKVVRGNPNPRSYYKCTHAGCPVRKHVERASHDPKAVITTYEGKHNHDVPTAKNSNREFAITAPYIGNSKIRTEENGSISLDLGVGINHIAENKNNEHHNVSNNSNMMVVQASQASAYYGNVNGGLNLYGKRDNGVEGEGHSFQTPPLHLSNQYPQTLGRILMGP